MAVFERNKYSFTSGRSILPEGEKARSLRENEIFLMSKELFVFKILVKDLVVHKPGIRDKNIILNLAYFIVENPDIYDRLYKKREMPFSRICKETGISRVFLETWHDYIITYVIILANPNYKVFHDYLKVVVSNSDNKLSLVKNPNEAYRGLVLKVTKRKLIIMTSDGEFIKIKKSFDKKVGDEAIGVVGKSISNFKMPIFIALTLLILLGAALYVDYNKAVSTVLVDCTSQIKIELNRKNKVIYVFSEADRGKEMVDFAQPEHKDIDTVLRDCIEYANENSMIDRDGIVVTITGDPLEYGTLKETAQYVYDNNVKVRVNNGGFNHNLNDLAEK